LIPAITRRLLFRHWLPCLATSFVLLAGVATAADLPRFVVPGQEPAMQTLEEMHALHAPQAFNACTLWDGMLPHATLWTGPVPRQRYRAALLARPIDRQGYVAMQQHRGLAHSDGWPFPAWQQSGGAGFHFSKHDEVFATQMFNLEPLASAAGWEIDGATVAGIDPVRGLVLEATGDVVTITTPPFRCGTIVAPFARIEWAAHGLPAESRPAVSWILDGEEAWAPERRMEFPRLASEDGMRFADVPLYRHPAYAGLLTRYRITIDHATGAKIDLKSVITAIDTRHPTNGPLFIRACSDYFNWTVDLPFLRQNIGRMRQALQFTLREFAVREQKHVWVRWVGHDGRSGLESLPDGTTKPRLGLGVGNNYWDHRSGCGAFRETRSRRPGRSSRGSRVAHQPEDRCGGAIDRAILSACSSGSLQVNRPTTIPATASSTPASRRCDIIRSTRYGRSSTSSMNSTAPAASRA
jgi:hypothetical protein